VVDHQSDPDQPEPGGSTVDPSRASIDGLDAIAPTIAPSRVGAIEIAQIRDCAMSVKRGDMRWGGGFGFDAALVETRRARDLLDARCPPNLRNDLLVAVGWLACNTGFMAFDIERYRDAARLWNLASHCAEETDNWSLLARVLGSMARQSTWLGRPDDALALIERVLDGAHDRLVPTEHAMLWALRARACAEAGDVDGTEAAIGTADQWFAARDLDECEDRPWITHYSHAHHWGDTGLAWDRLAISGHSAHAVVQAGGRHQAAADGHGVEAARSHALALLALAHLDTLVGDLDRGVEAGHRAVEAAQQVSSGRVRENLGRLHEATTPHMARTDVAELRGRITAALLAA
jgi:tetratricopeptide (TPR) repeat protein